MFRTINKNKPILKIVIYSVILTWFAVILIKNWHYMSLSWFKNADFKAIGNLIESSIPFVLWFVIIFIVIYKSLRVKSKGNLSNEEYSKPLWKRMNEVQSEWDDFYTSPDYHNIPSNIWHKTMAHKKRDP